MALSGLEVRCDSRAEGGPDPWDIESPSKKSTASRNIQRICEKYGI